MVFESADTFYLLCQTTVFICSFENTIFRSLGLISLLAVPGLLLSTGLTAILSLLIPEIKSIVNVPAKIYIAFMFGAMLSATDPVAVVALLKELGKKFIILMRVFTFRVYKSYRKKKNFRKKNFEKNWSIDSQRFLRRGQQISRTSSLEAKD